MTRTVNIGLIGAGTVGGGVLRALKRNGALMASRLGVRLRVTRVAVRSLRKPRDFKVPANALTTDWRAVVEDPKVDLVVINRGHHDGQGCGLGGVARWKISGDRQ